jgi:hypothetical protein
MDSLRKLTGKSTVPPEVFVSALVAAGGGLLFVIMGLVRWQGDGDAGWVKFPAVVAVLELVIAAGLVVGFRPARVTGIMVFAVFALVHLIVTLNDGPLWIRIVSGVLSAAHVYGVVLLNTGPAREHLGAGGAR